MTGKYSIKDLERLSGVKAHTIRIWEKRYNLLDPNRTLTNIRFYTDEQLKRLLDVALLQRKGLKISRISQLDPHQFTREVEDYYAHTYEKTGVYEGMIHQFIKATLELNDAAFERLFSHSVLKIGLVDTMREVIFPLMVRVGIFWNLGNLHPGQEHFVSNLVKQKLFAAIDGLVAKEQRNESCLLYLMETELHELSLLFAAYLIKGSGRETIYIGQSVPIDSLLRLIEQKRPNWLITNLTTPRPVAEVQAHLDQLAPYLHQRQLIIVGHQPELRELKLPPSARLVDTMEHIVDLLKLHN